MTLEAVRDAATVVEAGTIRPYRPNGSGLGEVVILNNLLACVARFGTGEFVVPLCMFDLCAQDLYDREGIPMEELVHRDGSYRRLLEHCTIWFDSTVVDVFMKASRWEPVLRVRLGTAFELRSDDELREAIKGA